MDSVLHSWGSWSSMVHTHFPLEKSQAKGLTWHQAAPPRMRGDRGKKKQPLFLKMFMLGFFFFFCANDVSELLCWTPDSHKVLSSVGDCQN